MFRNGNSRYQHTGFLYHNILQNIGNEELMFSCPYSVKVAQCGHLACFYLTLLTLQSISWLIGLLMRNIYNVTIKTPLQQEVRVALKCVCSLLNIKGICFAIMSFQFYLCLHSLLPGFESRPRHVGKLPVTWSYVVVFAGYSGFLHYLQLASHELATIGINVT